jgi:hypothetical protein
MAICNYCGLDMTEADGCTDDPIVIEEMSYEPIRFGREPGMRRVTKRCHDCQVVPGRVHHHGCDTERCPACGRQSISCGCIWAGEEHLNEDWIEELEERFLLTASDVTCPPPD